MTVLLIALLSRTASAQDQVWTDFDLHWIKSHQVTFELQVEPKVLASQPAEGPGWATLDVTPSAEFTRGQWIDVLGQLLIAGTKQTDSVNSTELTPRLGFRFHVLSNLHDELLKEKQPKRRVVIRNLVRFEWRNLYYSSDEKNSSTFRIRDRIELEFPINRRTSPTMGSSTQ